MTYPFSKKYPLSQGFNDKCCRASYTQFGLMGHNGWDIAAPSGTEILYPHDGKITELTFDSSGYGNYVKIENDIEASILAHMKNKPNGKIGDTVKEGSVAGIVGSTGNSSGPHLHFGYIRNPRNKDNGFNGYVDQSYFIDLKNNDEESARLKVENFDLKKVIEQNKEDYKALNNKLDSEINNHLTQIRELNTKIVSLEAALDLSTNNIKELQMDLEEGLGLSKLSGIDLILMGIKKILRR